MRHQTIDKDILTTYSIRPKLESLLAPEIKSVLASLTVYLDEVKQKLVAASDETDYRS